MVGGGVFGNWPQWIRDSIQRALEIYQHSALDVSLVHYSRFSKYYVDNI